MAEDEKAALRRWAVEKSVELFAGLSDPATSFQVLAYANRFRIYVETGERPR